MKKKPQRPPPTKKKANRTTGFTDAEWEEYEGSDWEHDCQERERKKKGPSEEAKKLLNK